MDLSSLAKANKNQTFVPYFIRRHGYAQLKFKAFKTRLKESKKRRCLWQGWEGFSERNWNNSSMSAAACFNKRKDWRTDSKKPIGSILFGKGNGSVQGILRHF